MGLRNRAASRLFVAILHLSLAAVAAAEDGQYPLIASLSPDDILFRQVTSDVEAFHYAQAHRSAGALLPSLTVFRYKLAPGEDISGLAARLNLNQATLATLNRVSDPASFRALPEVLVPNLPGVFVPDKPTSELEQSLAWTRTARSKNALPIVLRRRGAPESGRFYAGEDFTPQELIRFFRGFFRSPVVHGRVSSRFGSRMDPFGGGASYHGGVDIVAPRGTPVLAAQAGEVLEVGSSGRYGTYVLLSHGAAYQTMYAHLDTVTVGLRQHVDSGTMIGTVGNSGLTTGTHLHFEIHWKGQAVDPLSYLPAGGNGRW
jgi:murein DD-endopeptidase MepM/ murein hydrolase activator NlpD